MVYIDDTLVDSAISIKNEFNILKQNLGNYESEAKLLTEYLLKITGELEQYISGPIKQVSSINEATKHILDKMTEMETESDRISKLIDPINVSIERLKRDEEELYLEIKKHNPNSSDDEIRSTLFDKMKKTDT